MMESILKAADYAAQRNDRYLFVALLALCVIGIAVIAKWLAAQYNRILREWREDMATIQKERREDMKQFSEEVLRLHKERVDAAEGYTEQIVGIHKVHIEESRTLFRDYSTALADNSRAMTAVARSLADLQHSCAGRRDGSLPHRDAGTQVNPLDR